MACKLPLHFANPLLPWLPDETLFSLASRHHRLWGNGLSSQSAKLLFGAPHAGTHHDFPNALSEFAERTSGALGQAEDVAEQRTLLRFYRAFCSDSEVRSAAATMASPSVAHLKLRLGLLTSRFRAHHPLKACRPCIHDDALTHGWAYWHLEHQYPGVWVCAKHDTPLQESALKSSGVERFLWHLPSVGVLRPAQFSLSASQIEPPRALSAKILALVQREQPNGWLHPARLLPTLTRRLRDQGMITRGGSLRLTEAAAAFLDYCEPLRQLSELSALPSTLDESKAQIGRILRPLRTGTHPLRILVAIDWLFESHEDFVDQHLHALHEVLDGGPHISVSPSASGETAHPGKSQLLDLMTQGRSARGAAHEIGVDVGSALIWASQAGLQVSRRPKALTSELRAQVIASLSQGTDKLDLATGHGLSISTITRVLLSEPGLRDTWSSARLEARRAEARRTWSELIVSHPGAGTKIVRALEPAAYAWLYRNDRAWLISNPVSICEDVRTRSSGVKWDRRDEALSAAVERAALSLFEQGSTRLRLWQLYQVIPELKAKLATLDRLPLTRTALDRALSRAGGGAHGEI
jgi:hypothetical protein